MSACRRPREHDRAVGTARGRLVGGDLRGRGRRRAPGRADPRPTAGAGRGRRRAAAARAWAAPRAGGPRGAPAGPRRAGAAGLDVPARGARRPAAADPRRGRYSRRRRPRRSGVGHARGHAAAGGRHVHRARPRRRAPRPHGRRPPGVGAAPRRSGALDAQAEQEGLAEVAVEAQVLLDAEPRRCLVHGDLDPEDLLLDPDTLEVTRVLDWELAHAGHPATDLGNVLRPDRAPAYVDAVLAAVAEVRGTQPATALALARAHDLLRVEARTGDLGAVPPGPPGFDTAGAPA
ncbi:phosphotransferase [Nocardioides litoris]|uniref:phosphotransferase n=1 Tax=Nocardioides litoris TaxID=1926648 RepID=UPI00111F7B0D|nr:phosphotransferase [Nocardioides litoris]